MNELYNFLRSHHMSVENARAAEAIARDYAKDYAAKECAKLRVQHQEIIQKLDSRIAELSKPSVGFAEMVANAIKDNPDLFKDAITPIIKENLSLDDECVAYSGRYVELDWDNCRLGSIRIENYSDD